LKSLDKAIGLKLKQLRKDRGYNSQESFAEALGVDRTSVARWEAGTYMPHPDQMKTILTLLNIMEEDLWPNSVHRIPPDILDALSRCDELDLELVRRTLGIGTKRVKKSDQAGA
jgi:transcriptional regulator with XRE-family HTH domain